MAYVKLIKWTSSNGQTAVSFPTQPGFPVGFPGSTNILRAATAAADHATMIVCTRYRGALRFIPQGSLSDDDYRAMLWEKGNQFSRIAHRRYLKLFKAMGMK